MAATTLNLMTDVSTVANFKSWAQAISNFIGSTAGWLQSSDTGQVNWSTISSVPASNSYVYEIWEPNDGLTNFYLRMEYGLTNNGYGSTRISVGTSTNGAGTLTGFVIGPWSSATNGGTGNTTTLYPCHFSGAPGRLVVMMWDGFAIGHIFSVERSVDSSGTPTGTHVTGFMSSWIWNSSPTAANQQTILFGAAGLPPAISVQGIGGPSARYVEPATNRSTNPIYWNNWGFDLISPYVGYWDYQLTNVGFTNNTVYGYFTSTVYGTSHNYYASYACQAFTQAGPTGSGETAVVMRYD